MKPLTHRAAEAFATAVARTPDRRLAMLMSGPARQPVLRLVFWRMPHHLRSGRIATLDAGIEWRITGRRGRDHEIYRLSIADGRGRVTRGRVEAPATATIELDAVDFLKLATGNADPIQMFFTGSVRVSGDLGLAAQLASLFRIPTTTTRGS